MPQLARLLRPNSYPLDMLPLTLRCKGRQVVTTYTTFGQICSVEQGRIQDFGLGGAMAGLMLRHEAEKTTYGERKTSTYRLALYDNIIVNNLCLWYN